MMDLGGTDEHHLVISSPSLDHGSLTNRLVFHHF